MKPTLAAASALALAACVPAVPDPVGMATNAMISAPANRAEQRAEDLALAFEQAEANAARAGDDAMSCDAIVQTFWIPGLAFGALGKPAQTRAPSPML